MARRRKFSDEYKREAVRLATQPGVTQSQVDRELGDRITLVARQSNGKGTLCAGTARKIASGRPKGAGAAEESRVTPNLDPS